MMEKQGLKITVHKGRTSSKGKRRRRNAKGEADERKDENGKGGGRQRKERTEKRKAQKGKKR